MLLVVKDSKKATSWWKLMGEWFGAVLTMRLWTSWRNALRDNKHSLEFRGEVGTLAFRQGCCFGIQVLCKFRAWQATLTVPFSQPRSANRYLWIGEATWPACNVQIPDCSLLEKLGVTSKFDVNVCPILPSHSPSPSLIFNNIADLRKLCKIFSVSFWCYNAINVGQFSNNFSLTVTASLCCDECNIWII